MRHLLLILLIMPAVVLSCGCLNGGSGTVFGSGLEITALEAGLTRVYSGEAVDFAMRVKNTGSFDADGKASFSIGNWICDPSGDIPFPARLMSPNEERGTAGGEAVFRWKCTAPQISEDMTVPYEALGQVKYNYKSVTSATVTLLKTQDLIDLRNSGGSLPVESSVSSHSPISIGIGVEGPIRMLESGAGMEFPVTITIENSGDGSVLEYGSDTDYGTVDLKVEGTGGLTQKDCDYSGLHLWRGTSQEITCTMAAQSVSVITQASIVATLSYGYVVSKTLSIEVEGTRAAFR